MHIDDPCAEMGKTKNAAQHTSSQHRHQHHHRAWRRGGLPLFHLRAKGSSDGHNTARNEAAVVTTRVRQAQQTSKAVPASSKAVPACLLCISKPTAQAQQTSKAVPACLLCSSKPTAQAQQTSKAVPACLLCSSKPTTQCKKDKQAQPCSSDVHFKK